ncbi:MAG: EAL domain-containing protein [Gammaproteobacteria bacterium]|nr:EAL domain-containing protein [Gammaproteobacteria bacterium]
MESTNNQGSNPPLRSTHGRLPFFFSITLSLLLVVLYCGWVATVALALGLISVYLYGMTWHHKAKNLKRENSRLSHQLHELQQHLDQQITKYKHSKSQSRKLSSALEQTADSVFITNRAGYIEYVNPAFEKITGYSRESVIGKLPTMLKSGKHDRAFYADLWSTLGQGKSFNGVFINVKKGGLLFYEEKTITPLKNSQGEVTHYISTGRDISERMREQEQLQFLAHHDSLTGLPNRNLFNARLRHTLQQAEWDRHTTALLLLDMDRFKVINDTLGHDIGDRLLKEMSERIQTCLRDTDTVARLGGDEFAVILDVIETTANSRDNISAAAKKILNTLATPFTLAGREYFITVSIGISLYPDDGSEAQTLLKKADMAMYIAKESGRNNYQFYHDDKSSAFEQRIERENALANALERNEFTLEFQPIVNTVDKQLISLEALIRWDRPHHGRIPPQKFVPLLEETGLIFPVGEWVLRTACAQNCRWQEQGYPPVSICVNISIKQLRQKEFLETISTILDESTMAGRYLTLEISETQLAAHLDKVSTTLKSVRNLGVQIAVDDFGSGSSPLSAVKKFPADSFKIDPSLIKGVLHDIDSSNLTPTVINLAHDLGLTVVAEGVEYPDQVDYLAAQQCDQIQGYVHCPPIPAKCVEEMLFKQAKPKQQTTRDALSKKYHSAKR